MSATMDAFSRRPAYFMLAFEEEWTIMCTLLQFVIDNLSSCKDITQRWD